MVKSKKTQQEQEEEEGENVESITYGFAVGKKKEISSVRRHALPGGLHQHVWSHGLGVRIGRSKVGT